ncbi:uncharacterized protein LODBEIA_P56460 [Lodderomyces beijingensis]|uniref:SET domain-containing protein n=1 Tax=Lodderomyces beijingensis TaxID=1775926 RepID=A0ABP0ZVC4_9ASCO
MFLNNEIKNGYNEKTMEYLAWLKTQGVKINPKVTIFDYTAVNQGRGVIATENLEADEVIATIPKSVLVNVTQNSLVKDYPHLEYELVHLNHWDGLIITLLYEFRRRGESRWASYLDVLPTSHFNQLMWWNSNELNMLQPSCILERIGKDSALKMFERILKIINRLQITELNDVTTEQYNVVATLIMSYSFDVEITDAEEEKLEDLVASERKARQPTTPQQQRDNDVVRDFDRENESEREQEQEQREDAMISNLEDVEQRLEVAIIIDGYLKSMVPFADTLNADTNYNNAIVSDADENLVIKTITAIKTGDQIYNTYSDHPNSEILRRYGYVELEGSKFDFGEIPLSILKQFFLEKYNVDEDKLDSLLDLIGEISNQEQMDEHSEDGTFELVIESYDCFKSGEVIVELIFLVQLLTTFFLLDEIVELNRIRRVYRKCHQLIESKTVTSDFITNFNEIFKVRMDQYPNYAAQPFNTVIAKEIRDVMAETVLKSEYQSLSACKEDVPRTLELTLGDKVKIIKDEKFLRAIRKKRLATDADADADENVEQPPIKKDVKNNNSI